MEIRIKIKPMIIVRKTKTELLSAISEGRCLTIGTGGAYLGDPRIHGDGKRRVYSLEKHRRYEGKYGFGTSWCKPNPNQKGHYGTWWIAHVYDIPESFPVKVKQITKAQHEYFTMEPM